MQIILHSIHSEDESPTNWSGKYYRVLAFDPAKFHLAYRIEDRYPKNGKIKTREYGKVNISGDILYNLNVFLDSLSPYFPTLHIIFIELQPKRNFEIEKIAAGLLSILSRELRNLPLRPLLYEIDSHLKGNILLAPKQADLKKWSVMEARREFELTKDKKGIKLLDATSKKDDKADLKVMIEAAFIALNLQPQISLPDPEFISRIPLKKKKSTFYKRKNYYRRK